MKYSETDLTEATKVISYLRSVRIYAVILLCASLLYPALKIGINAKGTELYLLYFFSGIIILGSFSIIVHLNRKTAILYGASSIIAGVIYLFCVLYYRSKIQSFFIVPGVILGIIILRQGISVTLGRRSQEAFSKANQEKVSFIKNLLRSMKKSLPNDKDVIHCISDDNGEKRDLSIKFIDNIACFLLKGHSAPIFVDRGDVYILELRRSADFLSVCITLYSNEWLEAEFTPDDFKKYEKWKKL
jgi:hypothetical protein